MTTPHGGIGVQFTPNGAVVGRYPLEHARPRPGEVLLAAVGTTICEADRRFYEGSKRVADRPITLVPGHEAVVRVLAVGDGVTGVKVGDYAAVKPHIVKPGQEHRHACVEGHIFQLQTVHAGMGIDGVMSEYMTWPASGLCVFTPDAIEAMKIKAAAAGLHWTAAAAETEHVACVLTALEHTERAEHGFGYDNFAKLRVGKAKVLVYGSGWMGKLHHDVVRSDFPGNDVWVREPDEARRQLFLEVSREVHGSAVRVAHPEDDSARGTFDIVIMATSARQAHVDAFTYLRPGGTIVLFSGIHEGATSIPFGPARDVDLERLHRDGMALPIYRTSEHDPADMVLAFGSSGYSDSCFEKAATRMPELLPAIAAGITGVVIGVTGERLHSLRSGSPPLINPEGVPIMPRLLTENWPGRSAHLKVAFHLVASAEIWDAYANKGVKP